MPFIGACTSPLAVACSRAIDTSFRDLPAHHGVSIMNCQWGTCEGMFHRTVAPPTPMEFRAAMSLFWMPFLSSSDRMTQSPMARSIARLWPQGKAR